MEASDFKTARLKLGLTQAQIAKALGITRRQVINLETGKTPVRGVYETIIEMAVRMEASAPGASGFSKVEKTK